MDDEEKYLFLPTIPQRTVPVWIPTCDDDDDDDDYDDDGAGVDSNLRSNVFQSQFSVEGPKNQHSSIVHDFKDLTRILTLSLQSASKSLIALKTDDS